MWYILSVQTVHMSGRWGQRQCKRRRHTSGHLPLHCVQVSTHVPVRRQAFLEAPSIASRLKLGLTALRKHRKVLAALMSLKGLDEA